MSEVTEIKRYANYTQSALHTLGIPKIEIDNLKIIEIDNL